MWVNLGEGVFRVILGDYVMMEDGIGIVYIVFIFGVDDV